LASSLCLGGATAFLAPCIIQLLVLRLGRFHGALRRFAKQAIFAKRMAEVFCIFGFRERREALPSILIPLKSSICSLYGP
jgi:hypothetical protein